MRTDARSLTPAVSAALLALTVTLCTGSLADGATARLLLTTPADAAAEHPGDGVSTLLLRLSEAARQFCQPQTHFCPAPALASRDHSLAASLALAPLARWVDLWQCPTPVPPVRLSLLNLPPPVA